MGDKPGTRVFKKSSPNSKLTVYLGKRDFVDHLDHVDPVDGVVLVDPEYLKDRKVFVTLTCAFRYGREDLDVLGLSFRKVLFSSTVQVFPCPPLSHQTLSQLQEKLIKKLGLHAYPFNFTIPHNLPCSVTLQPGPEDTGKACGVDFELQVFCAKAEDEKIHQRNSVHLLIRKVQYAPETPGPQPMVETSRNFLMSDRSMHLEASLDKELYYHGEPINVNVHVTNNSTKTVKKIKVSVRQYADICLFSTAQYMCPVALVEAEMKEASDKETMGILVSYKVRVKAVVSLGADVAVELPFVLMHPKPKEETPIPPPQPETSVLVDTNLIELETNTASQVDDLVFEDFARLQFTDMNDKEEDPFC